MKSFSSRIAYALFLSFAASINSYAGPQTPIDLAALRAMVLENARSREFENFINAIAANAHKKEVNAFEAALTNASDDSTKRKILGKAKACQFVKAVAHTKLNEQIQTSPEDQKYLGNPKWLAIIQQWASTSPNPELQLLIRQTECSTPPSPVRIMLAESRANSATPEPLTFTTQVLTSVARPTAQRSEPTHPFPTKKPENTSLESVTKDRDTSAFIRTINTGTC